MADAPLLPQFFSVVGLAFAVGHGDNLAQAVPVDEAHPWFWPLHGALQGVPDADIAPGAVRRSLQVPSAIAEAVSDVIAAVLRYVRDARGDGGFDGTYAAFKNILGLQVLYADKDDAGHTYAFVTPLMMAVCRRVAQLGSMASAMSTQPLRSVSSPRGVLDEMRQALEKSVQVASAPLSPSELNGDYCVTDALWGLGVLLWRTYAARRLHAQAAELARTFRHLRPSEVERRDGRANRLSAGEITHTYFLRGQLWTILLSFRDARPWLEDAWRWCPPSPSQQRAILVRLVPVALLRGSLPRPGVLAAYGLEDAFGPLVAAFRSGNIARWRALLRDRREWLRARDVWLLLFERGEILVWRNLFRHALKAYYATSPDAPRNRCPTWVFEVAAQVAFNGTGELEDGTLVQEDIICVLSSLIDQSLVAGNVSYSQKQLVMRPSPDGLGAFESIARVKPRVVHAIT